MRWQVRGLQSVGGWGLGVSHWPPLQTVLSSGRSHVMQRVLSTMQFLWVLGQALVDGLTRWLHTFTRHHSAMSNVLRAERYLLAQELLRVSGYHCTMPHPITPPPNLRLPKPTQTLPPPPPPTAPGPPCTGPEQSWDNSAVL